MKVGMLGCGRIARAFAEGWRRPDLASERRPDLAFYDIVPERARELAAVTGGYAARTAAELVHRSNLAVMAVKPPDVPRVVSAIGAALCDTPLVSLAAGVSLPTVAAALPPEAHVGRAMPNVAVSVGHGVILFDAGSLAEFESLVREVLGLLGQVVTMPRSLWDEGTAISGCGPAFVALFTEALEEAALAVGLEPRLARSLALGTAAGTGILMAHKDDAAGVKDIVATPGGMTTPGVEILEARGLREAVKLAVQAAVAKAKELAWAP
jgi:pyrroline-5-carboxylate reductase